MIKFSEIQVGDFVQAEYNGKLWNGQVIELNKDEKQVCVRTDVQDFWFEPENLHPIPITNQQLMAMNFTKQTNGDESVKYLKGVFRLVIPKENDFSFITMWYREDRRSNPDIKYIHQLQNHYYQMTKVHLTKEMI
jgi:hypothetical protein